MQAEKSMFNMYLNDRKKIIVINIIASNASSITKLMALNTT